VGSGGKGIEKRGGGLVGETQCPESMWELCCGVHMVLGPKGENEEGSFWFGELWSEEGHDYSNKKLQGGRVRLKL